MTQMPNSYELTLNGPSSYGTKRLKRDDFDQPNKRCKLKEELKDEESDGEVASVGDHGDEDDNTSMGNSENAESSKDFEEEWSKEDIRTLLEKIRDTLPNHDIAKFTTQTERTDWSVIEFGNHTKQQCKTKWLDLITKVRRYRTMSELVNDCFTQLSNPSKKSAFHPDMPKKPLTPFFRFFNEHRQDYAASHPHLSVTELAKHLSARFKELSQEDKQSYVELFNREYAEYKETLNQFKFDHPEVFAVGEDVTNDVDKPPKPTTALYIYIDIKANEEKKKFPEISRKALHEKYRKIWSKLPERNKLKYIRMAVEAQKKYEEDLKTYCCLHPEYEPKSIKNFLNKAEQRLVDKEAGKPEKPPPNGYGLFTQEVMSQVLDLPNNERMQEISRRWKILTQTEREDFNKRAEMKNQLYKDAVDKYLLSLPENARQQTELQLVGCKSKVSPKEERPLKPINALYLFIQDKKSSYEKNFPKLSEPELNKLLMKDYSRLSEKEKMKYKQLEEKEKEKLHKLYSQPVLVIKKKKSVPTFPGEPARPPASGYHLFSTRMLVELKNTPNTERLQEISRRWRSMGNKQRLKYSKEKDQLAVKYKKDVEVFRMKLSPEDRRAFDLLRGSSSNSNGKKKNRKKVDNDRSVSIDPGEFDYDEDKGTGDNNTLAIKDIEHGRFNNEDDAEEASDDEPADMIADEYATEQLRKLMGGKKPITGKLATQAVYDTDSAHSDSDEED